jgi:sulfoxide reductase heme-binding subunit YedZ
VTLDQLLWLTARAAAISAFFVLAASLVTGQAVRTAILDGVVRNRDLLSLHVFLTVCWLPLLALHIAAITLDGVSRVGLIDLVIPFRVSYAPLAIGLGSIGLDLLIIVMVTSLLRRHIDAPTWRWLHRLAYIMFAVFTLHGLLAGTDFTRSLILAPVAAVVAFIAILSIARIAFGRVG